MTVRRSFENAIDNNNLNYIRFDTSAAVLTLVQPVTNLDCIRMGLVCMRCTFLPYEEIHVLFRRLSSRYILRICLSLPIDITLS
jgi:RNA binding exosome subunit